MNQVTEMFCTSWNHLLGFCECPGLSRTDLQEKCVHCVKCLNPVYHNCFAKYDYYCYCPINCPFFNTRSIIYVAEGFIICPLKNINNCSWYGKYQDIWSHCVSCHAQNSFDGEAIIKSYVHLKLIEPFRYYTSNFLVKAAGDKLFLCSFEVHSNGTHRWCVTILKIKNKSESENYAFRLQFRPLYTKPYDKPLMAQCLNIYETLFKYPNKEIVVPRDMLAKYYNAQDKIFYRLFIDQFIHDDILPGYRLLKGQHTNSRFWNAAKRLEKSNYDEYCKCVKDMDRI